MGRVNKRLPDSDANPEGSASARRRRVAASASDSVPPQGAGAGPTDLGTPIGVRITYGPNAFSAAPSRQPASSSHSSPSRAVRPRKGTAGRPGGGSQRLLLGPRRKPAHSVPLPTSASPYRRTALRMPHSRLPHWARRHRRSRPLSNGQDTSSTKAAHCPATVAPFTRPSLHTHRPRLAKDIRGRGGTWTAPPTLR